VLDFMGIGAQKAGTTWLYQSLKSHPEISFPAGKEVHFWDARKGQGGLESYLSQFADDSVYNGEITPAYAILPPPVIQEVYEATPDVRLIYLIRNPKNRAWSSARMALCRAEMEDDDASDQWFIDHFNSKGSIARGDYEKCVRNWRSVFPGEQILIETYDDLARDPVRIANQCLAHIGLRPFFTPADYAELSARVFAGDGARIRPSLREALSTLYDDKIRSLEEYLHMDLTHWRGSEW
jgi:Sulfotransferase domain